MNKKIVNNSKNLPGKKPRRNIGLLYGSMGMTVGALLTVCLTAYAEWRVQDRKVREVGRGNYSVDAEEGTAQGKYNAPEDWMRMESSAIKPDAVLPGASPRSNGLSRVEMSMQERCETPPQVADILERIGDGNAELTGHLERIKTALDAAGLQAGGRDGLGRRRWEICMDIVETQQAQAKYNLMMSELASTRYQRLRELQEDRNAIGTDEAGKLQSNTNAMIALVAQVQIDQQQQKAMNDAYSARLVYLQGMQETLGRETTHGRSPDNTGGGGSGPGLAQSLLAAEVSQRVLDIVLDSDMEFTGANNGRGGKP